MNIDRKINPEFFNMSPVMGFREWILIRFYKESDSDPDNLRPGSEPLVLMINEAGISELLMIRGCANGYKKDSLQGFL